MGRLTDIGPGALVPAAWLVTIAAHTTTLVSARTIFIALVVMDVLLAAFFVASRGEMTGVLQTWQTVIVLGLLANLLGTVDMALSPASNPYLWITLYAWMVLPGVAYVSTARAHTDDRLRRVYFGSAALSLLGAGLYALGQFGGVRPATIVVVGLAVVGVGQTAGIATAVLQNAGPSTTQGAEAGT